MSRSGRTASIAAVPIAASIVAQLRGSPCHSSPDAGKFLGSKRERSIPPRPSSSSSLTRISSRSSRRASSAGDSADGAAGLIRGTGG